MSQDNENVPYWEYIYARKLDVFKKSGGADFRKKGSNNVAKIIEITFVTFCHIGGI